VLEFNLHKILVSRLGTARKMSVDIDATQICCC